MASISQVSDVFAVFAATHTTYGITSAEILPTTLHWWHAIDPTKFCLLRGGGSTKHCQHYANYQHQAMV